MYLIGNAHTEDILWFKPVELHTKLGRRGHIKEPLGRWEEEKVGFTHSRTIIIQLLLWLCCVQAPMDT